MAKGIIVALLHLAIVGSLFGKLMYDRATRPRVWVKAAPYDPQLPIRGRYLSLRLELEARGFKPPQSSGSGKSNGTAQYRYVNLYSRAYLRLEDGKLVAVAAPDNDYLDTVNVTLLNENDQSRVRTEPVLFFIPEHALDPSRRPASEELWVEVTVPKKGPPRPIRLGVKKDGGEIQPIEVHNP